MNTEFGASAKFGLDATNDKSMRSPDPLDLTDEDEELALLADPQYSDRDRDVLQKESAEPEQCDAEVWERPSYFRKHQCPHPGKRWVNNKWLCGIHAKAEDRRAVRRYG